MVISRSLVLPAAFFAASCAGQTAPRPSVPGGGLVGHWTFDAETKADAVGAMRDRSGKGNHATLGTGAATGQAGELGAGLLLDGKTGAAECPNNPSLNPGQQLTVMTWFRLSKGTLESQKLLISKSQPTHAAPYYQYAIGGIDRPGNPNTITFYLTLGGVLRNCPAQDLPTDLYAGWHHAAGTYDGQTMRLYVDGSEAATSSATGAIAGQDTPVVLGAYGNLPRTAAYCVAGGLDDVAIYERALAAAEIEAYYWSAQADHVLSHPGTGKVFGSVADDHFAAQSFVAAGPALQQGALWLAEPNDDELLVQLRKGSVTGEILAAKSLSAGPTGKRPFSFTPPVRVEKGATYVLKVCAGAPGTKRGAVQEQTANPESQGVTDNGPSDQDMALELRFLPCPLRASVRQPKVHERTAEDSRYEKALNDALRKKRDVWGEALIARPEGPTYENIVDYLRPMTWIGDYVTTSGVHYVVFGQPAGVKGGGDCALHVADGSEIISRHHKSGRRTTFFIGPNGQERYGEDLRRLDGPHLAAGYQPVLRTTYAAGDGGQWEQESFATAIPETSSLVSFVRFTFRPGEDGAGGKLRVRTSAKGAVADGNSLRIGDGTILIYPPGGVYEPPYLTFPLGAEPGRSEVTLVRLNQPAQCQPFVPTRARMGAARQEVCAYWDDLLSRGARFSVPEERVMDAMRNLLVQNLFMTWRYSIGNAYESWYPQESGDALKVLGEFGFLDHYRENLQELLPRVFRGKDERPVEWANKLYYTAHYTLLSGDHSLMTDNQDRMREWRVGLRKIMAEDPLGLLGKTRAGDIHTHCYYSHHQANGWRGLRDGAVACAEVGWQKEAEDFAQAAAELRTSFVAAFNASKVDMPDGTLFWPKALTGSPATPYDPLTATRLGSYWNLSIGSALRSGVFDPRGDTMRRTVDYMLLHGAFFLGLTRFNYYPVPVGEVRDGGLPGYNTTGADNVYGLGINEAMMEQDRADRIVLGLYGKLAHGMTRGTFISGEGDAFGPVPGEYHRSLYLPPSNTNNALFLKTLHDMLVFNHIGAEGKPEELLLAHATPRAWLADGKEIQVENAPTLFGAVSFHLRSQLAAGRIDATVTVPARRAPRRLALRLRTPQGQRITNITVNGREHERFDPVSGTIDLTGLAGSLEIRANY